MSKNIKPFLMAGAVSLNMFLALCGSQASATTPYPNTIVQGSLVPGVYGRIDIGNAPPPPLIYTQPVIIQQREPTAVRQRPLYLHVPPGHAKKWSKHCAAYNACNRPVYFVKVDGNDGYEQPKVKHKEKNKGEYREFEERRGERYEHGHGEKHGNKHGDKHGDKHGKGKGHDKD